MLLFQSVHIFMFLLLICNSKITVNGINRKELLISESAKMDLMQLDMELIGNLERYAEQVEDKVAKLQRIVQELRQPLEAAKGKEEEYLGNPLHSFPLIRHMYQDWRYIEEFMNKTVGEEQIDFLRKKLPELPWQADTEEATVDMIRMAETYGAKPWEMAQGLIDNVAFNTTLSALDCFEIAKMYFKWGYFVEAHHWLVNTKSLLYTEYSASYEVLGLNEKDVALLQARCLMELDLKKEAKDVLLAHPELAENSTNLLNQFEAIPYRAVDSSLFLTEDYKRLCRSSFSPKPSRLHCRYNSTTSPFLILAPLKMEEISLEPYIVVYHDILPDKDIMQLIILAEPQLKETKVFKKHGATRASEHTSLGTFLPFKDMDPSGEPLLDRLTQRMRDITGIKLSDRYNFIKYGFGAHYSSHYDYFNASNSDTEGRGDRIATVIFYLNDAPFGGATVFPRLNIKIPAERGKVLFWYNMNGETHHVDPNTLHAACPVIYGSKLAMAAWIHEWEDVHPTHIPRKINK
ncbi:prolyl 4-hydroxylase subunit alpha-1 [Drosophila suzukii]|uniref:procollagen-proline 4-dioxygenase n=1 Tax=Drosophila suzukii TaxID=28584 RepID=A0AB40ABP8_DROSZ